MNILKSLKEAILSAHFITVDSLISRSFLSVLPVFKFIFWHVTRNWSGSMSILVRRRQRFSGHKQSREAKPMKGQIIFHAQLKTALTIRSHCKLQMHLVCIIEHSIGKCSRNQRLWIMINEKKIAAR